MAGRCVGGGAEDTMYFSHLLLVHITQIILKYKVQYVPQFGTECLRCIKSTMFMVVVSIMH